jgi:predicted MFS family arabinose efflux permease
LGLTSIIIGFGELSGSVSSGLFIDRIGKRRGALIGMFISGVLFLQIPWIGKSPFTIRAALLATMVFLEFTIVSLFPLYSEQVPEARATEFSLIAFGTSVGFVIGPSLATFLWSWKGVFPVTLVGALCVFLAGILVWWFLFEDGGSG